MNKQRELTHLSVRDFLEALGSDRPSPGGGAAAALLGATGAALAEMTARINAKRKSNPDAAASLENAEEFARGRATLLDLVTRDTQAFETVMAAWKTKAPDLPEKLRGAAAVPLSMAENIARVLEKAPAEIPRTSRHLVSDLAESGTLLLAALKAAHVNVEVNLRAIEDKAFTDETRAGMTRRLKAAAAAARKLEEAF